MLGSEILLSLMLRGGSCHKYHFCRDKRMLVATNRKSIIFFIFIFYFLTNICRDKHNFVARKLLSRQTYFCRDKRRVLKHVFVTTNMSTNMFVATKMILVAAAANDR